jgi:hypothetical protein
MKHAIRWAVCISILAVGLTSLAGAQGFSNQDLNDKYGFHTLALSLNKSFQTGPSYPFAISGYYQFNGDGTLSGADTVSEQGVIFTRQYSGTYSVNADGTGTLQLNISPDFQPVGNFVIVESGREIEIIFAVPGNLNAFTLRKQHTSN